MKDSFAIESNIDSSGIDVLPPWRRIHFSLYSNFEEMLVFFFSICSCNNVHNKNKRKTTTTTAATIIATRKYKGIDSYSLESQYRCMNKFDQDRRKYDECKKRKSIRNKRERERESIINYQMIKRAKPTTTRLSFNQILYTNFH